MLASQYYIPALDVLKIVITINRLVFLSRECLVGLLCTRMFENICPLKWVIKFSSELGSKISIGETRRVIFLHKCLILRFFGSWHRKINFQTVYLYSTILIYYTAVPCQYHQNHSDPKDGTENTPQ